MWMQRAVLPTAFADELNCRAKLQRQVVAFTDAQKAAWKNNICKRNRSNKT
jgi:hypothetical protein